MNLRTKYYGVSIHTDGLDFWYQTNDGCDDYIGNDMPSESELDAYVSELRKQARQELSKLFN
jgi:hypothetical protein